MSVQRTIGLSSAHLRWLVGRLRKMLDWDAGRGRPKALTLGRATTAVLMYLRQNMTQETLASLFGVGQATISRLIAALVPAIGDALEKFVPDLTVAAAGRVVLVDGSLTPCWNWANGRGLYSGKARRTGHNHQFVADLEGTLLHVSDPQPGSVHDIEALRRSTIPATISLVNALADKGYIGSGMITPSRKPKGGQLHPSQKATNQQINSLRAAVERAIAIFKTWRVVHTPFRQPLPTYPVAFRTVRALYHYSQASHFE